MIDKVSYTCDKITDARESIEMLECVESSIDRDVCTGGITIIRNVQPESLSFVIRHAITTIKRCVGVRDWKDHTKEGIE